MKHFIPLLLFVFSFQAAYANPVDWAAHFNFETDISVGEEEQSNLVWCVKGTVERFENTVCLNEISAPCYNDVLAEQHLHVHDKGEEQAVPLLGRDALNRVLVQCRFKEYLAWELVIDFYGEELASKRPEISDLILQAIADSKQARDATCLMVSKSTPVYPDDPDVATASCLRDAAGLYAYLLRSHAQFKF